MLREFRPFMSDARLTRFQGDLDLIDRADREVDGPIRSRLSENSPAFSTFDAFHQEWPGIDADMSDLLRRIKGNVTTYQGLDALPSFSLFPWFFVIPGGVLALTGGASLIWGVRRTARAVAVVIGVSLLVAPIATSMFGRASAGGQMMSDFTPIMTTDRVHVIQGYFGTMAVDQGSIRLQVTDALRRSGLSDAQIAADYPAITQLDADWVGIINDMTPMIGAMSDNVDNFDALTALPPFPLFPWFFALPGALLIALGLAMRTPRPDVDITANNPNPVTDGHLRSEQRALT